MTKHIAFRVMFIALATFCAASCATGAKKKAAAGPTPPPPAPLSKSVAAQVQAHEETAQNLYRQGHYDAAVSELAQVLPLAPRDQKLRALFYEIQAVQTTQRARVVEEERVISERKAAVEVESNKLVPLSYGQNQLVSPAEDDTQRPPSAMELALRKPVALHFDGSDLGTVLLRLGQEFKVNIITDPAALTGKQITLHVEGVPLKEVFQYLTRNHGVAFYVGENVVWMTQQTEKEPPVPFETRIFHLRHGVNFLSDDVPLGASGSPFFPGSAGAALLAQTIGRGGQPSTGGIGMGTGAYLGIPTIAGAMGTPGQTAAGASSAGGGTTLEQAITLFVPKTPGSQILFDRSAHVLISKNTRENNALIEKLIQNLDIVARQVLIEARFLKISVDDLSELGIDFALNSPYATSQKTTVVNGKVVNQPQTIIDQGNILSGTPFSTDTATQGLNLAFKGVLTDPMFKAVLHAIETSTKATSISNPRVTTVNNHAANMFVGSIFQYFSNYSVQSVYAGTYNTNPVYASQVLPTGSPTVVPLGIELTVTPSVGASSQYITLVLAPSITAHNPADDVTFESIAPSIPGTTPTTVKITLPIFTESSVTSKAIVRSGETVVLGGLITNEGSKGTSAPPILGRIPLLGRLFRHNIDTQTRSNLLIFVTATLISPEGQSLISPTPPNPSTPPTPATQVAPTTPTGR